MIIAYANPVRMMEQGAPRIIRTDEELARYTRDLFELTAQDEPTDAELEAIDLLSMLIERYERQQYPLPQASPIEVLRFLMDRHGLKQKDLVRILDCSESSVSLMLHGARNLTVPYIRALSAYFHVPGSVFLAG